MSGRTGNPRVTVDIVHLSNEEEEMEEENDDDNFFKVPNLKRKLLADFGRPSILEMPGSDQMRVYLRIRPFSDTELDKNENQSCLTVDSETTVSTHAPKDSHYFKNTSRALTKTHVKYSFSKIFDESTTQKDFFNSTMLGLVKDFIEGQNCLVFSYGVTSSGKTYTIQGNPKDAGVLPRALDVLFNSINGKQYEGMNLKPTMFTNVQRLTAEQELIERRLKDKILKLSCDDDVDVMSLLGDDASDMSVVNSTISSEGSNISVMDPKDSFGSVEKLLDSLGDRVREDAMVSVEDQGQIRFSVWVCFSEIYNEQIFDLLEPLPNKKNARRPCLKLSEDHDGSPYIKGLKYINVTSADEAYRLLTIGQRNLQKACTKLNHNSSRSHCIFNIKVLRVIDKDDPQVARVSMLSLCDLAGSERYSKTQNTGERLKEAGNINTSLLTLGRCIQTLRFNQANKERTRIVPFRESKLTRLFQNFFVGRGKAAMFVNVNQCASMFDETQHVFKFSAVASQVVMQQKPVFVQPKLPVNAPIPRSSIMWDVPRNKVQEGASVPLPDEDDDEDLEEEPSKQYTQENIDELLGLIESLENQLQTELRAKSKLEATIRAEVCQEMANQFTRIEEQCSEQIRIREQMAEEMADKRIQIVVEAERAKRKRLEVKTDNEDEWVSSMLFHQEQVKVENRDKTIEELNSEMISLKDQLTELTSSQEQLLAQKQELDSKVSKLEVHTCPTDDKNDSYIKDLEEKVSTLQETVDALKLSLAEKAEVKEEEEGRDNLVENLTQQLQQARLHSKEQDREISELNDMLTEAGETFQQKESEIHKLKELTQEYELKMEKQSEALKLLERGISDSQSAMETADKTMSRSEQRVEVLRQDLDDITAEVQKYRNKARFFEEQVVEKEQECQHWRGRYEQDCEEHSKSQEALIHGFKAEISNLRSQLFSFKTQLHLAKSPHKSPAGSLKSPSGGSIKSPAARVKLFSVAEPSEDIADNQKTGDNENKASKHGAQRHNTNHDVTQQLEELQAEMDKNCRMISELEQALQASRATVDTLEKNLQEEKEEHKKAAEKIKEMEESKDAQRGNSEKENCELEILVKNKSKELDGANEEIKELKAKTRDQQASVSKLEKEVENRKEELVRSEENREELQILNDGLKEMVNKTTNEIQQKDNVIQCLSPQKSSAEDSEKSLKCEITKKIKEIEKLNTKLTKLNKKRQSYVVKLNEVTEKCNEFEFRINEKEFENQEQKKQIDESTKKIESLECSLNAKTNELCKTGEELALIQVECRKYERELGELRREREQEIKQVSSIQDQVQDALKQKETVIAKESESMNKYAIEELKLQINKMEQEKTDLKAQLQDLQNQMDKQETKNAERLKEDENRKEKTIEELKLQIEKTEQEKTDLKTQLQDLQNQIDKQETKNAERLKEDENRKEKTIEELKLQIEKTEQEKTDLKTQLQNLQNKMDKQETKNAERLKEDENKKEKTIEEFKLQIEKTEQEKAELKTQLQNLQSENEKHEANYSERLKEDMKPVKDAEKEIQKLKDEIVEKDEEINMFSENLNAILQEQETLQASVDELTRKHVDTDQKMQEKDLVISKLTDEFELTKKTVNCMNDENEKMISQQETIIKLEAEVDELKSKLESVSCKDEKMDDLTTSFMDLESAVADKEVELCNKDKVIDEKSVEIENLKTELVTLKDKLQKSENSLNCRQNEIDDRSSEITNLSHNIEHLKETIQKCETEKCNMEKVSSTKEQEISQLVTTVEALEQSVEMKSQEVEARKQELEQFQGQQNQRFEKMKAEFETEKTSMSSQHSEVSDELEKSEEKVSDLEKQVQMLNNDLDGKTAELNSCQCELSRAKENLREAVDKAHKLEDDLDEKSKHVDEMKDKLDEFQMNYGTDKVCDQELNEALSEIKELKATVISHKKQHQKVKGELEEALLEVQNCKGEIENLRRSLSKNVSSEVYEERNEELMKVHQQLEAKCTETRLLEKKVEAIEESLEKANSNSESLRKDLNDKENVIVKMNCDLDNKKELTSQLEKQLEVNKDTDNNEDLQKELRELRAVNKKYQQLNEMLQHDTKILGEISHGLNKQSTDMIDNSDTRSDILKEVRRQLDIEKENQSTEGQQSPQKGVRQLRKEKIELQNSLVEAKFKNDNLEKEISELKSKMAVAGEEIRPLAEATVQYCQDTVLQRKFSHVSTKLKETETSNRTLIKEVSELQSSVEQLQADLEEERRRGGSVQLERENLRRSHVSSLQTHPRTSICSPVSKIELTKTREREQTLKGQLSTAKGTMEEWMVKFSDIEAALVQKGQELTVAHENISKLQKQYSEETRELDREVKTVSETNKNLEYTKITLEGELQAMSILVDDINVQLDKVTAERDKYKTDYSQLKKHHHQIRATEMVSGEDSRMLRERLLKMESDRDSLSQQLSRLQKQVSAVLSEKETLSAVLKENNIELKEMEKSLTVARQDLEDLKSRGGNHVHAVGVDEIRRDTDKLVHDLNNKVHHLQADKKEFEYKLKVVERKLCDMKEMKHEADKKLQEFREERDKLVSGLEAVLKKKDGEIKKHKDMIRQLKEREIQLTHSQKSISMQPEETSSTLSPPGDMRSITDTEGTDVQVSRSGSTTQAPESHVTEIQTLDSSPGSKRRNTRTTSTKRGGRKRVTPPGPDNMPSKPKRRSIDSMTPNTESDTGQSQTALTDATHSSTRTRRARNSNPVYTVSDDVDPSALSRKPSTRSARSRFVQAIKESPMAKTSKRLLENIAETLSPRSPTRSPSKSPSNSPKKESSFERRKGSKRALYTAKDVPDQPNHSPLDTTDLSPQREEVKVTKTRSQRKRRT